MMKIIFVPLYFSLFANSIVSTVLIAAAGVLLFQRVEKSFVDVI